MLALQLTLQLLLLSCCQYILWSSLVWLFMTATAVHRMLPAFNQKCIYILPRAIKALHNILPIPALPQPLQSVSWSA